MVVQALDDGIYRFSMNILLLRMSPENTFGPCLCARHLTIDTFRTFIQIVDDIVVVVGSVIVHVSILQEFWPAIVKTGKSGKKIVHEMHISMWWGALTEPSVCTVEAAYDSCRLLVVELRLRVRPQRHRFLQVPTEQTTIKIGLLHFYSFVWFNRGRVRGLTYGGSHCCGISYGWRRFFNITPWIFFRHSA